MTHIDTKRGKLREKIENEICDFSFEKSENVWVSLHSDLDTSLYEPYESFSSKLSQDYIFNQNINFSEAEREATAYKEKIFAAIEEVANRKIAERKVFKQLDNPLEQPGISEIREDPEIREDEAEAESTAYQKETRLGKNFVFTLLFLVLIIVFLVLLIFSKKKKKNSFYTSLVKRMVVEVGMGGFLISEEDLLFC